MLRRPTGSAAVDSPQSFAVRRGRPRSRRRLVLRSVLILLGVTAVTVSVWWLRTSPVFAVSRVESGAYRFTSQEKLETVFSTFLGRNIWTLSGAEVADSLAVMPWVRDLRVRRRLPGSILVDFREWRPLLVIEPESGGCSGHGQPLVVVEDGRVLDFPGHLVMPGLPVLVGVDCRQEPGQRWRSLAPEMKDQVLELVAALEASGLETVSPVDFVVARDEGFAIVLQNGRGTLLVGREDFTRRLERYMSARDHLEAGLQMDLRFADRITCRRI